jgi:hypothetical protein
MSLDRKILEELKRFNQINTYVLNEQEPPTLPPAPEPGLADTPPATDTPPPTPGETPPTGTEVPEPVDVATDPDVEEIGAEETTPEGGEEEIDITDLVTTQMDIKDKQEVFMDSMFRRLDDLQSKLEGMDEILNRIQNLESKFDKYRDKTPEEKLMLRSLDSYPYNQKLTDFFDDKQVEMEKSGKNEYVLTSDEVENFSPNEVLPLVSTLFSNVLFLYIFRKGHLV